MGGVDPGYARCGRVQALADARAVELARGRADGAMRCGRAGPNGGCGQADGRRRGSLLAASGWVVEDTLSARLHPRQAAAALVAAIARAGG